MKKTVTIFGSTGSIGRSSIDIIKKNPYKYQVIGLSAKKNYVQLAKQAIEVQAKYVCIRDNKYFSELKKLLSGHKINVLSGDEGLKELCELGSDLVVAAIVGAAGLQSTYQAIINGSNIALANKESLVCGGELIMSAAKKHNVILLPTDSEHNAIFQVFEQKNRNEIDKITLTASGGPFLNMPISKLENITPEQATKHPNWSMGKKITVDCSNLANKGLEVIEAHYLFDLPVEKIDVLIHPQSIIHGMVHYVDGSVLAQLGNPDMRTPISYVLDWPKRPDTAIVKPLDLAARGRLDFHECDYKRFPAMRLCRETLKHPGTAKIVLNAANEVAVENFLQHKIKYPYIVKIIEYMLNFSSNKVCTSIEEIIMIDQEVRTKTQEYINGSLI